MTRKADDWLQTTTVSATEDRREGDNRPGKHHVIRTTCNRCGAVLSEMHYGCCGHASSGFGTTHHKCPGE